MKMTDLGLRHLQLDKQGSILPAKEKVESTNYLVSKVGYLLGVQKSGFIYPIL